MFVAIIPAYNEELTIGSLVIKTRQYVDEVLVIDDGSTDSTSEIASSAGAKVITLKENVGKAQALCKGIEYAKNISASIVLLDADGQHNPDDIPFIIQPILKNEAQMVIGSRFINTDDKKAIPAYRKLGQTVLTRFTNLHAKSNITDSQSGYRAIHHSSLDTLDVGSEGYNIESDMIYHFNKKGKNIIEVPVNIKYDVPHKHKKSPITHGFGVLVNIINKISETRPLLYFGAIALISSIIGVIFLLHSLYNYQNTHSLLFGSTIIGTFFFIIAFNSLTAGIILNHLIKT